MEVILFGRRHLIGMCKNMEKRTSKLCSISEAVAKIKDGDRVAFGGFAVYQKPMAIVREIVRQHKRNLTIVGVVNSLDVDMLVGAGCVSKVETSYVGLEKYGLAPNYRRAVQNGEIEVAYFPEMLSWDRFRADREGWPYWPVYYLGDCEIVLRNKDIIKYSCPVTGKPVWAIPSAKADVVIVHAYQGDKYGNLQLPERHLLPQIQDADFVRSCKNVIATVEKLVDTEEIKLHPERTFSLSFRCTNVVNAPFGSHPTSTLLAKKEDEQHFQIYCAAAKSKETFEQYLKEYVYTENGEADYVAKISKTNIVYGGK